MQADVKRVFIVGTGRCGTVSCAELLSELPGVNVEHEGTPKLLDEVSGRIAGTVTHADIVDLLRRSRPIPEGNRWSVVGEANQRLSFVLPELKDAFPSARLIWLIRDGRDTVNSMVYRGWYRDDEARGKSGLPAKWAVCRIRAYEVGEMSKVEWRQLDAFARCCWYWDYTNRIIPCEAHRLRFESLVVYLEETERMIPEIARFLGVSPSSTLRVPHSNRARGGRPPAWREWSRRHRAVFENRCGDTMDHHYPGWREDMKWTAADEVVSVISRTGRVLERSVRRMARPLRRRMRSLRP